MKHKSFILHTLPLMAVALAGAASVQASVLAVNTGHNSSANPQLISSTLFSSGLVAEIENSVNPDLLHVSMQGTGDSSQDWFIFEHLGGRLILDIDNGISGTPAPLSIGLYTLTGLFVASSSFGSPGIDAGSTNADPFIDITEASPGLYYAVVLGSGATFSPGTPTATGTGVPNGTEYTLQVAIPEPSTALLGGLGVLALLRRRR